MSVEQELFSEDIQSRVANILHRYAVCRDSDKLLWLYYTDKHCGLSNAIKTGDPASFYGWLNDYTVPTFESLSRCRRKLQEKYPQLRGRKYKEKKESAQRIAERINVD